MVLFNTLDSVLAINRFKIPQKMSFCYFWGLLTGIKLFCDVLFSTAFTSSYDFSIPSFWSNSKFFLTLFAVYSDHPSSFIHEKKSNILHLYDDPFLPTHNFLSSRCHVGLKTIIVYNRAKTENKKSTKPEKSQRIIRWISILLIIENRLYFLFLISILQKKDVSATIFRTHLKTRLSDVC